MVLARRCLWIHERDARRDVAELARVLADAFARVVVNAVHAQTAVLPTTENRKCRFFKIFQRLNKTNNNN